MISEDTAIIVLGQCLNQDGSIPATLTSRVKTLTQTLLLFVENNRRASQSDSRKPLVILTGGDTTGVGRTEARAMLDVLVKEETTLYKKEHSMEHFDIILEESSKSTVSNALFCWPLIASSRQFTSRRHHDKFDVTIQKVMLITSDFHGPRALLIFQSMFDYLSNQQGHPFVKIELVEPLPTTPMPNAYDTGINALTPKERIQNEIRICQNPAFQDHVRCQLPYMHFPPISCDIIQECIEKLNYLLESKYSTAVLKNGPIGIHVKSIATNV